MMRARLLVLLGLLGLLAALLLVWMGHGTEEDRDPVLSEAAGPERPALSGRAAPTATTEPLAAAHDPRQPAEGTLLIRGGWGSGTGMFGRRGGQESNPEAPMGLRVDSLGNLLVLDQVNRRVQRFDRHGHPIGELRLDTDTAQDLALDAQGRTLVLDRLGREPGLRVFDEQGRDAGTLPIVGGKVAEGGAITGVFSDADGVYVETEHDDLVRVADSSGRATGLSESVPGRPTRDGRLYLKAGLIDKTEGRLYVQAHHKNGKLAWEKPLQFSLLIIHILLLDSDLAGQIYVAAEVGREDPTTHAMSELYTQAARLSAAGALTGTLLLPPTTSDPAETFRPLTVGDDGTLYHMVVGPEGLIVKTYRFP